VHDPEKWIPASRLREAIPAASVVVSRFGGRSQVGIDHAQNNMRVVIAGFGPFPGAPSNPSGHLATALARRRRPAFAGVEITSHVFATAYNAVDRDLPKLLAQRPDVLLIFGLAGRRQHVCIETRARNARSILFSDVSGWRPDRAVIESGQSALTGSAPFPRLLNALQRTALPARLSRDAGAYLCNYAYWRALQSARGGRPLVQFVHIPSVSATSRRASRLRSAPALSRLVAAGENLLIALIAASRRLNPSPIAARPISGSAQRRNHSSCAEPARRNASAPGARSRRAAKIAR
jgi:pyroglutamyl-peptidase